MIDTAKEIKEGRFIPYEMLITLSTSYSVINCKQMPFHKYQFKGDLGRDLMAVVFSTDGESESLPHYTVFKKNYTKVFMVSMLDLTLITYVGYDSIKELKEDFEEFSRWINLEDNRLMSIFEYEDISEDNEILDFMERWHDPHFDINTSLTEKDAESIYKHFGDKANYLFNMFQEKDKWACCFKRERKKYLKRLWHEDKRCCIAAWLTTLYYSLIDNITFGLIAWLVERLTKHCGK